MENVQYKAQEDQMKMVLFIEEKPQIREKFINHLNGLSNYCKLLTTKSVVEAVEILNKIKIDVVTSDKQFNAKEIDLLDHGLAVHKDIKLIVLAQKESYVAHLLKPFNYSIEIPTFEDPDLLTDTLCESLGIDYGGHIKGVSISSILQMIELEDKTCTLKVVANQKVGWLYCRDGNIIDAKIENHSGAEAALIILGMENPLVTLKNYLPSVERTIHARSMSLLLESHRLKDETDSVNEQRRYSRFLCSSPADLEYDGLAHPCVASNLSFSGVFLITKTAFPEGKQVFVSFYSHSLDQRCRISGTIVRQNPDGLGVGFSELNMKEKAFLREVLDEAVII